MITRNKNILYILYPATYIPLALAGSAYAKADFSNALYILYALLPFAASSVISIAGALSGKNSFSKRFVDKCSLSRFSVLAFCTYVACLFAASVLALAIRGRENLPFVMGAWMILLTIFSVYLFFWLYAVYRILYKDNPDFA